MELRREDRFERGEGKGRRKGNEWKAQRESDKTVASGAEARNVEQQNPLSHAAPYR